MSVGDVDHRQACYAGRLPSADVGHDRSARRPRRGPAPGGDLAGPPARHPGAGGVGQDPGAHPPHRLAGRAPATPTPATSWPSPSPARPPASCATGCAALGLRAGVAAGTFHGVAYAQLRARWADEGRTPPGAAGPQGARAGRRRGRGPGDRWPSSRRRDRVGEGPAGRARRLRRGRGRAPGAARPRRPTAIADAVPRLRGREAPGRAWSTSTTCCALCSHLHRDRPGVRRRPALAVPAPVRRRVPGREPAAARGCSTPGGATSYRPVRRRRPPPGHLRLERRRRRLPSGFRRLYPPADVVVLDGNYRSTPQILGGRGRRAAPRRRRATARCAPARHDGPRVRLDRHPNDRAEAAPSPGRSATAARPACAWSAQAVLVRTHAQIAVIAEALRRRGHPPPGPGRRVAARPARGAGGARPAPPLRRAADGLPPRPRRPRRRRRGAGGGGAGARRGPQRRRRAAEAITTLVRLAHDHLRLDPGATAVGLRRLAGRHAAGRGRRTTAATRSRSPRSTRRRGWSGRSSTWPGLEDGLVPITHARTPRPARRRRRGCCTWR